MDGKLGGAAKYMEPGFEFFANNALIVVVANVSFMLVGKEHGKWIVASLMRLDKITGVRARREAEQIHAKESARARIHGLGDTNIEATVEYTRHQAVFVDS